ncbi:hypothetical protein [Geobacter benzoatilyticus]|uniref:Uncharacterized protein n=1 Tax=Geobacter benzoatilyticus TaxID=2815309 RepID=A0ABX7Q2T4_9BACT|nr:hypothetical protein [Geobacter benzoatilyticus]QSV45300.1 hypothetical protein JZM60_14400 [Geobacter benzoatilyticus]
MIHQIETALKIGGFIVKTATAIGALLLLIYCSRIGFYPSGVTLGDTLLFVFFSLGFCFAYGILFYLLFCMGCLFTPFFRWVQKVFVHMKIVRFFKKPLNPWPQVGILRWSDLGVVLPGGVMLLIVLLVGNNKNEMALGLTGAAVMIFFWWTFILKNFWIMTDSTLILTNNSAKTNKSPDLLVRYKRPVVWIMYLLIPLFVFRGMLGLTLDVAAKLIGIRSEHVSVQLAKERVQLVQKLFKGLPEFTDRIEALSDGNGAILKGVDILFQGIGNRTLISIRTSKEEVRIPFPSQDVIVVSAIPNSKLQANLTSRSQ